MILFYPLGGLVNGYLEVSRLQERTSGQMSWSWAMVRVYCSTTVLFMFAFCLIHFIFYKYQKMLGEYKYTNYTKCPVR